MRKYLFLLGILAALQSVAQQRVIDDPNAQLRNAKNFHALEVSSAINVYLSQGNDEVVAVSAKDAKVRDRIRVEVQDGVLKIWLDRDNWLWEKGNMQLKAYVSFKTLDRLKASGASDIAVDGTINADKLSIRLTGASDFSGTVKCSELSIDQSGASDVTINGSVNALSIEASGASNMKGYDLMADHCQVRATGASDIKISVNKELNAHVTGASSVSYKGEAVIKDMHTSGASNISHRS